MQQYEEKYSITKNKGESNYENKRINRKNKKYA